MRPSTSIAVVSIVSLHAVVACSGDDVDAREVERLGQRILEDDALSANANQACIACHTPEVGGTGADQVVNAGGAVYEGSIAGRFGNRKPPAIPYAFMAPILTIDDDGSIRGGNFWDGRATGWRLGTPVVDQAQGPFLNPLEQALSSPADVVSRVCAASYGKMFRDIWGQRACDDPEEGFRAIAVSIAAFEASAVTSPFSSRFDAFRAGRASLTPQEELGLTLFEGKAQCSACHTTRPEGGQTNPAFTDFTFDNLGVPVNPDNPFLGEDTVSIEGVPINPLGAAWRDPGLGGFLEELARDDSWRTEPFTSPSFLALSPDDLRRLAEENRGRHRVPTLRNVGKRPRPDVIKAYMHNGWFKTLEGVVHFYNTRDVLPRCQSDSMTEAEALATGCWPAAEVPETVNHSELGDLGLTAEEEAAIVAFLHTLSDQ